MFKSASEKCKSKIKTKAKSTRGILQAIINHYFTVESDTVILLSTDAAKRILDNFEVIPKKNNEFVIKGKNMKESDIPRRAYLNKLTPCRNCHLERYSGRRRIAGGY